MSIAGKVAVVTGGGGGNGRATCLRLSADSAAIAIWDIAAAWAFLASEEANYITGQTLGVNGGRFLT